ncbi:uncharacterized protein LOC122566312 [Bombus pyrosoma]|uniref:uncharacterized protein LOC122566312 n=1 Tax=Bombus pyrosoma TaxID=396416 RepID=UPI001CB893B4|nr:uncharacterized protein LOC122566312 [Bombus pyrosoma]
MEHRIVCGNTKRKRDEEFNTHDVVMDQTGERRQVLEANDRSNFSLEMTTATNALHTTAFYMAHAVLMTVHIPYIAHTCTSDTAEPLKAAPRLGYRSGDTCSTSVAALSTL